MAVDQISRAQEEIERLQGELDLLYEQMQKMASYKDKYENLLKYDEKAFYSEIKEIYQEKHFVEKRAEWSDQRYIHELKSKIQKMMPKFLAIEKIHEELQKRVEELETKNKALEDKNTELDRELAAKAQELESLIKTNETLKECLDVEKKNEIFQIIADLQRRTVEAESQTGSKTKERMHVAEAKVEKLEESNLELQIRLEKEEKIKKDLVSQITSLSDALKRSVAIVGYQEVAITDEDGRQVGVSRRPVLKGRDAKIINTILDAKDHRIQEAEKEMESLIAEVHLWYNKVTALKGQLEKLEGKFTEDDVKAIFGEFGIDYGISIEKGEREDLYLAVQKAKKIDAKSGPNKSADGFDSKIAHAVKTIQGLRESTSAKNMITPEYVKGKLEQLMQPASWIRTLKAKLKGSWKDRLQLAVTTAVLVGVVFTAIYAPIKWNKTSHSLSGARGTIAAQRDELEDAQTTIDDQKDTIDKYNDVLYPLAELEKEFEGVEKDIIRYAFNIIKNKTYADIIVAMVQEQNDNPGETIRLGSVEIEKELDDFDLVNSNYNKMLKNVGVLDKEEKFAADSKIGKLINDYKAAVDKENLEAANDSFKSIKENYNILKEASESSTEAMDSIINDMGYTYSELEDYRANKEAFEAYKDMIAQPTIKVQFTEDQINTYSNQLIAGDLSGNVTGIEVANYEKATGKVTILANCQTKRGQEYVNHITFTMPANMLDVSASAMMNAAKNATDYQTESFTGEAVTDHLGNKAYVRTSNRFDKKTKLDVIEAEILVKIGDQVFSVSKSKQGDYLYEMIDGVKDELVSKLIKQIDQRYQTAFEVAMEQGLDIE